MTGGFNACLYNHPINHYGTSAVVTALPKIATEYRKTYPNEVLIFNDMSLVWGGLFDIGPTDTHKEWKLWSTPHQYHRDGTNLDQNFPNSVLPPENSKKAEKLIKAFKDQFGPKCVYQEEGDHWHWWPYGIPK